ncbi:hypothetical protein, partial [Sphingopyxis sp.]|uniref:hypothetical protein n=1 Tax=Sphingopyxis sp. TaxID=1908224 RepID=UPI0040364F38
MFDYIPKDKITTLFTLSRFPEGQKTIWDRESIGRARYVIINNNNNNNNNNNDNYKNYSNDSNNNNNNNTNSNSNNSITIMSTQLRYTALSIAHHAPA